MSLRTRRLETPIGEMIAVATPSAVCALEFVDGRGGARLVEWLGREAAAVSAECEILDAVVRWMAAYLDGGEAALPPIDWRGSDLDVEVWRALTRIPRGATVSYGELARSLGRPRAARAVAGAVGRNPVSVIVPCHRVLRAGGRLGGYGGGLERKRWLLAHEGIPWVEE